MRRTQGLALVALGLFLQAGCAHRLSNGLNQHFVREGKGRQMEPVRVDFEAGPRAAKQGDRAEATEPSLEEAIGKLRKLMAEARPEPRPGSPTVETTDPRLAAALKQFSETHSAEDSFEVGRLYHERQVIDRAHEYYSRAVRLNPRMSEAYEGLARVWRDWRLPHLGLPDAHRAVYYGHASASAQNTLGTILQALGQLREARVAYSKALALDSTAAYALNNLCYVSFVQGRAGDAITECNLALRIDPSFVAARNNLALTYAALGQDEKARVEFVQASGPAIGAFNMGLTYQARALYGRAAEEFGAAASGAPATMRASQHAAYARRRAESAAAEIGSGRTK